MASAMKFFNEGNSDPFSLADWELQDGPNPSLQKQRASELTKDGDEFAYRQFGGQFSGTCNYKAKLTGAGGTAKSYLVVPSVGTVVSGWHIDSWTVTYTQKDFPTLAITCHKHDTSQGGALDSNCRTYAPSFKVPACFGVPRVIEGTTANTKVFELSNSAVIDVSGLTMAMSVNHHEVDNRNGEHFAGDNYDGSETITVEFTGELDLAASPADVTILDGWSDDTFAKNGGNTVASTSSLTLTHHVAHTVSLGATKKDEATAKK